jgi:hypothetical protein
VDAGQNPRRAWEKGDGVIKNGLVEEIRSKLAHTKVTSPAGDSRSFDSPAPNEMFQVLCVYNPYSLYLAGKVV